MAAEDKEKTAFITPLGCYCYTRMPFGLKNAGSTFQRPMRKWLGPPMGGNAEAYIDDLRETFDNLRKVHLKFNPEKCACGVVGNMP